MNISFIKICVVVVITTIGLQVFGQPVQNIVNLKSLTGSLPINASAVTDNYNYAYLGTFEDAYANGYIRFSIDQKLNAFFAADSNYRVELEIQKYSSTASGTTDGSPFTITLSIRNNPDNDDVFSDFSEYVIEDCHKFKFKIKTIWAWTCSPDPCEPTVADKVTTTGGYQALSKSLNITYGIEVERYNDFDPTDVPPIKVIYDNTPANTTYKHLKISDFFIDGAYAYDIEWTYVNSYDDADGTLELADINYTFHNSSTRIRVYEEAPIELPAIFDKGYVIVRVRGIGKELVGTELKDEFGRWSLYDNYDQLVYSPYNLSTVNTDYYVKVDPTATLKIHEENKNWMFQSTFAEEGKMKHVITYYDGTLRNRQTVTQSPYRNDKEVLISEVFYDHVGRAAAQSLPTPHHSSSATNYVKEIKYYTDFNQVDLGGTTEKFSLKYFERDQVGTCDPYILPFDDATGAATYYSANNPDMGAHNAFLPNAEGYAYALTEFTNDNSGRIRRQTGLGPNHTFGSGHETKYVYGIPEQEELDRLFGNSAGNSNHYQKNLVIDPNGQVSVSYLDMKGNVIATALAGTPPENLVALKSEQTGTGDDLYESMATSLTINALGAGSDDFIFGAHNEFNSDAGSLTVNRTIMVTDNNTAYEFEYTLADIDYVTECMHEQCFDCVYDLTISLLDECGEELLNEGEGIVLQIGDMPLEDGTGTSESCTSSVADWSETINLNVGSYQLVKKLSVNQTAVNTYAALYIEQLESLPDPEVDVFPEGGDGIEDALQDADEDEIYGEEENCFKTYADFEAEALLVIDDLDICGAFDCEICERIEDEDDFIAEYPELASETELDLEPECTGRLN